MTVLYYIIFCFQTLLFDRSNRGLSIDSWRVFVLLFAMGVRLLGALIEFFFPRGSLGGETERAFWVLAIALGAGVHALITRERVYAEYARKFQSLTKLQRLLANTAVCAFAVFALISPVIVRSAQ